MEPIGISHPDALLASRPAEKIETQAREFEAMFLAQMLKPMFDASKSPSILGGDGPEQEAFGSLLHQQYANAIAARGGIGLADHVKSSLLQIQSETN